MIPDYQTLMKPVLECAVNGDITPKEVVDILAKKFNLSEEELAELLPSKRAPKFYNRVAWAKFYLQKAGLVKSTRRGYFAATDKGKEALLNPTTKIDTRYLSKIDEFQNFKNQSKDVSKSDEEQDDAIIEQLASTPDEVLRKAHQSINEALAIELISSVRACSPAFFENLIVDLLIAMGYGGTSEDAGRTLGRSGDNGVDGVIDQDPLGVDQIYI